MEANKTDENCKKKKKKRKKKSWREKGFTSLGGEVWYAG